jgi:hypothetical protein
VAHPHFQGHTNGARALQLRASFLCPGSPPLVDQAALADDATLRPLVACVSQVTTHPQVLIHVHDSEAAVGGADQTARRVEDIGGLQLVTLDQVRDRGHSSLTAVIKPRAHAPSDVRGAP